MAYFAYQVAEELQKAVIVSNSVKPQSPHEGNESQEKHTDLAKISAQESTDALVKRLDEAYKKIENLEKDKLILQKGFRKLWQYSLVLM